MEFSGGLHMAYLAKEGRLIRDSLPPTPSGQAANLLARPFSRRMLILLPIGLVQIGNFWKEERQGGTEKFGGAGGQKFGGGGGI